MFVVRSGGDWLVRAPAKLNLGLEVLARRDDGYHEIESLIVPISLYDTLSLRSIPSGDLRIHCRWAAGVRHASPLPDAEDNLVTRALRLLRAEAGVAAGAEVRLTKRIPAAAGLGGGSSDAAAALLAARRAWQIPWADSRLETIAAEIGSDVPFFLRGGAAVCRGRGERTESIGPTARFDLVVVAPPDGLTTADVYAACSPSTEPRPLGPLVDAVRRGRRRTLAASLFNGLEPAARTLSAWIGRLACELSRRDVEGHLMSGSGSAYFGICRSARHARRMAGQLRGRGLGSVFALRTLGFGPPRAALPVARA